MSNCPNDPIITNRTTASLATVACLAFCLIFGSSNMGRAGPLQDAAKEGDVDKIKQLVDQGADVNEKGLATALHYAVREGHVEAVELLITKGADVNATSTWGTPLHLAASGGHADIARLLLQRGADTNARSQTQTPLHVAATVGQTEVVRVLIDNGADINALNGLDPTRFASGDHQGPPRNRRSAEGAGY